MMGRSVKIGTVINGKRVVRATSGMSTFWVGRSSFVAHGRFVNFDDGTQAQYEMDRPVPGVVSGYAEPLPAGGVESKNVKTPSKVRASDGRWRGESVHGMSTRDHDLHARTNMYDVGRVNGKVGASRDGVGSPRLTGPSF